MIPPLGLGDRVALLAVEVAVLQLLALPWWAWVAILGVQVVLNEIDAAGRRRRAEAHAQRLGKARRFSL